MKNFRYKSINGSGMITKGQHECSNVKELIEYLYSKHEHLIEIQNNLKILDFRFKRRIGFKALSIYCRQIGTMLESGIPILDAVKLTSFQYRKGELYDNSIHVITALRKGATLNESMKSAPNNFPEFMLRMIKVGEQSGNLPEIFNNLSKYYYKKNKLKSKITGAALYPVCVLIFAVTISTILLTTVVPSMISMILSMGGEIPVITKVIMNISSFLKTNILNILIIIILMVALIIYLIRNGFISTHSIIRRMPLVSRLYFKNCGYEYLYAVYLMYSGGSSIVESLEGAAAVLKDRYLKEQITKCAGEIMKGSSIMEALIGMEVIDYTSLSIIRLGEESGKLTEMLKRLLIIIEDDLNSLMEKLLELIQPASIILVGALVGTIVLSIALPMFSMYNL